MATEWGQRRALGRRYVVDPALEEELLRLNAQYQLAPTREAQATQADQFNRSLAADIEQREEEREAQERASMIGTAGNILTTGAMLGALTKGDPLYYGKAAISGIKGLLGSGAGSTYGAGMGLSSFTGAPATISAGLGTGALAGGTGALTALGASPAYTGAGLSLFGQAPAYGSGMGLSSFTGAPSTITPAFIDATAGAGLESASLGSGALASLGGRVADAATFLQGAAPYAALYTLGHYAGELGKEHDPIAKYAGAPTSPLMSPVASGPRIIGSILGGGVGDRAEKLAREMEGPEAWLFGDRSQDSDSLIRNTLNPRLSIGSNLAYLAGSEDAADAINFAMNPIGGAAVGFATAINDKDWGSVGLGIATGGLSFLCFAAGTPVMMADGTKKVIEDVELKDDMLEGGMVLACGKTLSDNMYRYRGVEVEGHHAVMEDGVWKRVQECATAEKVEGTFILYPLVNNNHLIIVNGIVFADLYESPLGWVAEAENIDWLNGQEERNRLLMERYGS